MKKKLSTFLRSSILILLLTVSSCAVSEKPSSEVKNFFVMDDIEPPVLLEVQSISNNQVRLVFSEEVTPYSDSFAPNDVSVEGYSLLVTLTQTVKAGSQIMLEGRVKDYGGNTTGIKTPIWGYNPTVPEVEINEFTTRGEGNNPDRTELYIRTDGNMAGMALFSGIPNSWDSRVVFDNLEVEKGDYIVVWWTESLPENLKSEEHVFNVCACSADNLPGFNGVITLSRSPAQGADVIDCVVYSNDSATYEGYGTKTAYERALKAVEKGWWPDISRPVDSSANTATRSMCKRADGSGWYICVTKGCSFGSVNTAEEYSASYLK